MSACGKVSLSVIAVEGYLAYITILQFSNLQGHTYLQGYGTLVNTEIKEATKWRILMHICHWLPQSIYKNCLIYLRGQHLELKYWYLMHHFKSNSKDQLCEKQINVLVWTMYVQLTLSYYVTA